MRVAIRKIVWRFARDIFDAKAIFPKNREDYPVAQFTKEQFRPTRFRGVDFDEAAYIEAETFVFEDR